MTEPTILGHLRSFAAEVTRKMTALVAGEPEDQLRSPLESLLAGVAGVLGLTVVPIGETHLPDRTGTPDFAVTVGGLSHRVHGVQGAWHGRSSRAVPWARPGAVGPVQSTS